jgi:hypothetical protein
VARTPPWLFHPQGGVWDLPVLHQPSICLLPRWLLSLEGSPLLGTLYVPHVTLTCLPAPQTGWGPLNRPFYSKHPSRLCGKEGHYQKIQKGKVLVLCSPVPKAQQVIGLDKYLSE